MIESIYKSNLEIFGPEFAKSLFDHPAKPVPIENDVRIKGLKNPQYLVLVGFTTPRVLEQALRSNKEISFVLVVEPDLGIFHATMQREFLRTYVEDKRIDFVLGDKPEDCIHQMYQVMTRAEAGVGSRAGRCQNPEILFDPFRDFTEEEKQKWCDAISQASRQTFLAMGCAPDTFYRWERLIQNKDNIFDAYKGQSLFGKFERIPAIVLGGGQSLNEFIEAYKKYDLGSKAIIIACDAVLKILMDNGIKPHIVTRAERKFTHIFYDITPEYTKDVYFAPYPWVAPEYYDMFPKVLAITRGNGIGVWAKQNGMDPGEVNGGVSAANTAMEIAILLGCKSIILSGIDLCFLDGRSHVEGTEVEFDPEKSRAKWTEIAGNSGPVTSIPIWTRCLTEYEASIGRYSPGEKLFYNTSVRGAKISGTVIKPWSELDQLFGITYDIESQISSQLYKHSEDNRTKFNQAVIDLSTYIKGAKKELAKLLLNLKDDRLLAGREEERIVFSSSSIVNTDAFFNHFEAIKKSLDEAFTEPCRKIDVFKNKYFKEEMFRFCLLDTLQSDFFQLENKIAGLNNTISTEHVRKKMYIDLHFNFLKTMEIYINRFIELFDNGPNQTTSLDRIEEGYRLANEKSATFTMDLLNGELKCQSSPS